MCTRYYIELSSDLRPIADRVKRSSLAYRMRNRLGLPLRTDGEISPSDMVPVIAPDQNGKQSIFPMIWGYNIPGLDYPVVNVRLEAAPYKPIWKEGWLSHRCIIPASYYFEWEHIPAADGRFKAGYKYMIQPKGSETTYLAGIYRLEKFRDMEYPVFTLLTRDAVECLRQIHSRMPLILPSSMIDDWIHPETKASQLIRYAVTDLFHERCQSEATAS